MDAIGWTRVHGLDDHSQDAGTSAVLTDNVAGLRRQPRTPGRPRLVQGHPRRHQALRHQAGRRGHGRRHPGRSLPRALRGRQPEPRHDRRRRRRLSGSSLISTDNDGGIGNDAQLTIGFNKGGTYFVDAGAFGAGVQDIGTGTLQRLPDRQHAPGAVARRAAPHTRLLELTGVSNSRRRRTRSPARSPSPTPTSATPTPQAPAWRPRRGRAGARSRPPAWPPSAAAMSDAITLDATAGTLSWHFGLPTRTSTSSRSAKS